MDFLNFFYSCCIPNKFVPDIVYSYRDSSSMNMLPLTANSDGSYVKFIQPVQRKSCLRVITLLSVVINLGKNVLKKKKMYDQTRWIEFVDSKIHIYLSRLFRASDICFEEIVHRQCFGIKFVSVFVSFWVTDRKNG